MNSGENSSNSYGRPDLPETLPERIKKLLGRGIPGTIVADTVGCDPSYVSQLLSDEDYKAEVLTLRAKKAEGAVVRDTRWDDLEELALQKMEQLLPYANKLDTVLRVATLSNAAKRRAAEYSGVSEQSGTMVTFILPAAASVHFQMNPQSQVVEIDGRSTASLPTKNLNDMLKERKINRESQGIIDVPMPEFPALQLHQPGPPSTVSKNERKKVESILERIGYLDETVPVPKIV